MMRDLVAQLRAPSITNRPPDPAQLRRNDLCVFITVAVALLIGLGIRTMARNAYRTFALGEGLPSIRYPAGWISSQPEFAHFQATNPASPSSFDARVAIIVLDQKPAETLDTARANWALQRSQALNSYRELAAEPVTVRDGQPAILIHYAYVDDPWRASGVSGLPVVVAAEDLLFLEDNKLLVVTVAADATQWESEAHHFRLVFASLAVQSAAVEAAETVLTPVATLAATPSEGGEQ